MRRMRKRKRNKEGSAVQRRCFYIAWEAHVCFLRYVGHLLV